MGREANGPEQARMHKPTASGFERFAFCIARGEIALVVTKAEPSRIGIASPDDQSKAAALFKALVRMEWIGAAGHGIDVYESPDRSVRIFAAELKRIEEGKRDLVGFVRELSDPAFGFSKTVVIPGQANGASNSSKASGAAAGMEPKKDKRSALYSSFC